MPWAISLQALDYRFFVTGTKASRSTVLNSELTQHRLEISGIRRILQRLITDINWKPVKVKIEPTDPDLKINKIVLWNRPLTRHTRIFEAAKLAIFRVTYGCPVSFLTMCESLSPYEIFIFYCEWSEPFNAVLPHEGELILTIADIACPSSNGRTRDVVPSTEFLEREQ